MADPSSPPVTSSCCSINRTLLPLKLALFFWAAAAFSILPYLTIHMKDIGISDIDIAFIYSILPFTVFIAPPLVGFLADKLGNILFYCWQISCRIFDLQGTTSVCCW